MTYAAHLGWLHAKREEDLGTRFDEYQRGHGKPPPLPDLGPLEYLAQVFDATGRGYGNGMAFTPLPYSELTGLAWAENLTRQEARIIRAMSVAFVGMYHHAKSPFILPPWDGD